MSIWNAVVEVDFQIGLGEFSNAELLVSQNSDLERILEKSAIPESRSYGKSSNLSIIVSYNLKE